jgi:hypothetical protein
MEVKQYITLEVTKNDFTFAFQMQQGATWGSAIDASFEILQKLNELAQQSIQAMKPAVAEQEVAVVEPEVVGE